MSQPELEGVAITIQVPDCTKFCEERIVRRLMECGYTLAEINAGFALQAKTDGKFTVDSIREHIWLFRDLIP
jgi:hypothetical protein